MPLGVPKVSYRFSGDASPQWVDLYNRLYRQRILFLGAEIDDELANQLVAIMIYLNAEDEKQRLYLYINSPGGSVICGISIFDAMNHVTSGVTTICVGIAASMASFVLASGERGNRIAFPHSRVMIHQPMSGSQGQASDVGTEAVQVSRFRRIVTDTYIERTGKPRSTVIRDMDRDRFMSAREAKEYGLVDHVGQKNQN